MECAIALGNVNKMRYLFSQGIRHTEPLWIIGTDFLNPVDRAEYVLAIMEMKCYDPNGDPFNWYFNPDTLLRTSNETVTQILSAFMLYWVKSGGTLQTTRDGKGESVALNRDDNGRSPPQMMIFLDEDIFRIRLEYYGPKDECFTPYSGELTRTDVTDFVNSVFGYMGSC
jgi:hypothetical protein